MKRHLLQVCICSMFWMFPVFCDQEWKIYKPWTWEIFNSPEIIPENKEIPNVNLVVQNEPTPIIEAPPPTAVPKLDCLKDKPQGSLAIADLLNAINIGDFYDSTSKNVRRNEACFSFQPFNDVTAWAEPYGFHAKYRSPLPQKNEIDLSLWSVGVGGGAQYMIIEDVHVGGGMGYFHSKMDGKTNDTSINSLFFGPSIDYLIKEGRIGLQLFAIRNGYDEGNSWDIDGRVNGEYTFNDIYDSNFSLTPFGRIDYLYVCKSSDKSSFLYSKVGVKCDKTFLCSQDGFLSANISAAWINMLPISAGTVKCVDNSVSLKTETKNQLGVGAEVMGMHYTGLLVGLGIDVALFADAPMQSGRIRFEWSW